MTWISQVCAPTTPGTCALPCSRERERESEIGGNWGESEEGSKVTSVRRGVEDWVEEEGREVEMLEVSLEAASMYLAFANWRFSCLRENFTQTNYFLTMAVYWQGQLVI